MPHMFKREARSMSAPQELILLLTSLKDTKPSNSSFEYNEMYYLVNEALYAFFDIHMENTELSEKEREVIGPLIADSLFAIGEWVSYGACRIEEANIENYKIKRSGLEFLLEGYKEFKDGNGDSLDVAFQDFRDAEDIEGWDDRLKRVILYPSYYFGKPGESALTAEELKQIPKSHWWWYC